MKIRIIGAGHPGIEFAALLLRSGHRRRQEALHRPISIGSQKRTRVQHFWATLRCQIQGGFSHRPRSSGYPWEESFLTRNLGAKHEAGTYLRIRS
ncbi:hypothetical protein D3C72_1744260 [compost metagenome]